MQCVFKDWKQVGFFIKHSRSKVFMKFSRLLFSTVKSKSPIKIVLSYCQVNWPNVFDRWSRKYLLFWKGGLCNLIQSHFRFFTVKSSRIISITLWMDSKVRTLLVFIYYCKRWDLLQNSIFIPSNCLLTIYFKFLIGKWLVNFSLWY